jgi:hypothetical protein
MGKNILGKRVDEIADNLLISHNPCIIRWIRNFYSLLLRIFSVKEFPGQQSEPSRRPITRAPRRVGKACVCHDRKLSRVSLMAGGAPIVAGREVVDEEAIKVRKRIVDSEKTRRGLGVGREEQKRRRSRCI